VNYQHSILALAITTGLGVAPATHALELGEFNDTKFSIGGYFKTEAIYEKIDDGVIPVYLLVRTSPALT
jgi:hypothetical protein